MPIYLCKPGRLSEEPWRHGVQVYASPFPLEESLPSSPNDHWKNHPTEEGEEEEGEEVTQLPRGDERAARATSPPPPTTTATTTTTTAVQDPTWDDRTIRHCNTRAKKRTTHVALVHGGNPIRRIRHAEVVLVDQVSIRYGRYWFRLRWPGPRGGTAGFIALGLVPDKVQQQAATPSSSSFHLREDRILTLVRSSSHELLPTGWFYFLLVYE